MQVTKTADFITHALIGGRKTTEFKISGDAAMFNMLSAGLYSDQKLAVAREVLCNSWDSHIRAGKTDCPIIVSITEDKIIIRDAGAGIHDDMMEPLYCTYGGTDKTNNGEETGGFGLGCKSPFSYNDHFEVISWHAGFKTIYNISKSSAEKMGKPGMTSILSFPCGEETGLQVTIPLKNYSDGASFIKLFESIAFNGEMNVLINGALVKKLELSSSESNWVITNKKLLTNSASQIYVRYGNVVYPVESKFAYSHQYSEILSFLINLNTNIYGDIYHIVFQAAPNTISVTPSRESLSMQEHTINTLKSLLGSFFIKDFDKKIAENSLELLDTQIMKVASEKNIGQLMTNARTMPGWVNTNSNRESINSIAQIADQYTRNSYPKDPAFYRRDMGLRIDMALMLGVGKRGHLNQVKHQTCTLGTHLSAHEWFKKSILRKLYRDIDAEPMIKDNPVVERKRLSVIHGMTSYTLNDMGPAFYKQATFSGYLPLLRNVLVLTYSKKDLKARLKDCPELKLMGGSDNIWIYHSPVASTRIQATRDFFIKQGFVLIDLTVDQSWDLPKPVKVPDAAKITKPKLVGHPALSGYRGSHAKSSNTSIVNCLLEGAPRVTAPLFYVRTAYYTQQYDYRPLELGVFKGSAAQLIAKTFGDVCAVVRTDPQEKKLKDAGLMDLNHYVMAYVTKSVTSPKFAAYWAEDLNRSLGNKDGSPYNNRDTLLQTVFDTQEIRKVLGLKVSLDEHDLTILHLWREMGYSCSRHWGDTALGDAPTIAEAKETITKLPINQNIKDITFKLTGNTFIKLLNLEGFQTIARQPNAKANGHFDRLAKIIKLALMG